MIRESPRVPSQMKLYEVKEETKLRQSLPNRMALRHSAKSAVQKCASSFDRMTLCGADRAAAMMAR